MKVFDSIPSNLRDWALEQPIFWVATAPWGLNLPEGGHVNVSPKGLPKGHGVLEFVDERTFWYCEATGSGSETVAHLYENGRITVMFSAFSGPPNILRLYGKGKVFERGSPEFEELLPPYDERRMAGIRAIIWVDVTRVQTSCGYSVPLMSFEGHRTRLSDHFAKLEGFDHGADDITLPSADITRVARPPDDEVDKRGLFAYWALKNSESIDGLPALRTLVRHKTRPPKSVATMMGRAKRERGDWTPVLVGVLVGILIARSLPLFTSLLSSEPTRIIA